MRPLMIALLLTGCAASVDPTAPLAAPLPEGQAAYPDVPPAVTPDAAMFTENVNNATPTTSPEAGPDATPDAPAQKPAPDSGVRSEDAPATPQEAGPTLPANVQRAIDAIQATFARACTEGAQACAGVRQDSVNLTYPVTCQGERWTLAGALIEGTWWPAFTCSHGCNPGTMCTP